MDVFLAGGAYAASQSAEASANQAYGKAQSVAHQVERLEKRVERLSLLCQSMWELLRDQQGFVDEHLVNKVLEVDARDGRVDGKIQTQISTCPACQAKTNSKRGSCIFCGAPLSKDHLFEV